MQFYCSLQVCDVHLITLYILTVVQVYMLLNHSSYFSTLALIYTLQTILDVARQMKQDSGDDNKPLNMTHAAPDSLSFCANHEVADHNMFFLQSFIL